MLRLLVIFHLRNNLKMGKDISVGITPILIIVVVGSLFLFGSLKNFLDANHWVYVVLLIFLIKWLMNK